MVLKRPYLEDSIEKKCDRKIKYIEKNIYWKDVTKNLIYLGKCSRKKNQIIEETIDYE